MRACATTPSLAARIAVDHPGNGIPDLRGMCRPARGLAGVGGTPPGSLLRSAAHDARFARDSGPARVPLRQMAYEHGRVSGPRFVSRSSTRYDPDSCAWRVGNVRALRDPRAGSTPPECGAILDSLAPGRFEVINVALAGMGLAAPMVPYYQHHVAPIHPAVSCSSIPPRRFYLERDRPTPGLHRAFPRWADHGGRSPAERRSSDWAASSCAWAGKGTGSSQGSRPAHRW